MKKPRLFTEAELLFEVPYAFEADFLAAAFLGASFLEASFFEAVSFDAVLLPIPKPFLKAST
jgi:hypothetical protein